MAGEGTAALFPSREWTFQEVQGVSREYEHARLAVLGRLHAGSLKIVVASAQAALQYTMPPEVLEKRIRTLEAGREYQMEELTRFLVSAGYTRCDQVDGVCQFSQRGGILDFFPPHMPDPFRVEFWGDEIDTISTFKTDTQRRVDTVKRVDITPAAEVVADSPERLVKLLQGAMKNIRGTRGKLAKEKLEGEIARISDGIMPQSLDRWLPLLYPEPATVFDYLRDRPLFLCDTANCREALKNVLWQQNEDVKILLEEGVLFKGCDRFGEDFVDLQRHASGVEQRAARHLRPFGGGHPAAGHDRRERRPALLLERRVLPAAGGRAELPFARLLRHRLRGNLPRRRDAGGGFAEGKYPRPPSARRSAGSRQAWCTSSRRACRRAWNTPT